MLLAKQANVEVALQMATELLASGCDASRINHSETSRDALYYAMDAPKEENRVQFVRTLANEYNADVTLVKEAFPRATRQYLGAERTRSQGETAVEDRDEDGEEMAELERSPSLLNKVLRRLSRGTSH